MTLALGIWGMIDVRARGRVDPNNLGVHKTDFTVYTEAGAAFFDGRDPYTVGNPRGWKYLYPPLFAILVAPLHALPTQAQVLVWFAVSVLMFWGCHGECARIGRAVLPGEPDRGPFGPIPPWIGWTAVLAGLLPALNCLQRGQVEVAKLYLMLLGFRLIVENRSSLRSFLGGGTLALAIVLKVTPLIPIVFVLGQKVLHGWHAKWPRTDRSRIGASWLGTTAGLALFLFLLPATLVGWRANLDHLETWWNTVAVRVESTTADSFAGNSYSVRNQSLTNATHRLGNWIHYYFAGGPDDEGPRQLGKGGPGLIMDTPRVDAVLQGVRLLATGLLLVVGYRTSRADIVGQAAGFGLAGVATLVIIPIARAHYFVALLPGVMFLCLWLVRQRRPRWALFFAIVPGVLILAQYILLDVAGRVGFLGLGITLWYFGGCTAMLGLRRATASQDGSQTVPLDEPVAANRAVAA
jgi:hypothetical protein